LVSTSNLTQIIRVPALMQSTSALEQS